MEKVSIISQVLQSFAKQFIKYIAQLSKMILEYGIYE